METTEIINKAFSILTGIRVIILNIVKLTDSRQETINELLSDSTFNPDYKNQLIREKSETINVSIRELLTELNKSLGFLGDTITTLNINTEIFNDKSVISACDIVSKLSSDTDNTNIIHTLIKRFRGNFGALLLFSSLVNSETDRNKITDSILTDEKFGILSGEIETNIILLDSDLSDYNAVIIGLNRISKTMIKISNYFGFDFADSDIKNLSDKSHDLELRQALKI